MYSLTIPDLTPTIGLGWYFFIEMFDHFRTFFVGVFQLHLLMYVAPLCFAFRSVNQFEQSRRNRVFLTNRFSHTGKIRSSL